MKYDLICIGTALVDVMATHYHPDHMGLISSLMDHGVKLLLVELSTITAAIVPATDRSMKTGLQFANGGILRRAHSVSEIGKINPADRTSVCLRD